MATALWYLGESELVEGVTKLSDLGGGWAFRLLPPLQPLASTIHPAMQNTRKMMPPIAPPTEPPTAIRQHRENVMKPEN